MKQAAPYCHLRRAITGVAGCLAVVLLAPEGVAWATGQTLPVELAAHESQILVAIDADIVRDLRLSRELYATGRPLEKVTSYLTGASYQKGEKVFHYRVENWAESLVHLPDGVYSQRLTVEIDRWDEGELDEPLRFGQWFYYKVEGGGVEPISMREYSDAVAPPFLDWDHHGRPILAKPGTAVTDELPMLIGEDAFDEPEADAENQETFNTTLDFPADEGYQEEL